ncbi:hypothetical protein NDU88_002678 [Pleurodeles waltl]|uniref:Uncharacterized protein n=1 Tax=Pleurodeles waltl TaxID=8319 RepID=A0AAV7RAP4_PLEWA|nr:hypothetical protein NDU88_002678 [Pleurodeles waltl]
MRDGNQRAAGEERSPETPACAGGKERSPETAACALEKERNQEAAACVDRPVSDVDKIQEVCEEDAPNEDGGLEGTSDYRGRRCSEASHVLGRTQPIQNGIDGLQSEGTGRGRYAVGSLM